MKGIIDRNLLKGISKRDTKHRWISRNSIWKQVEDSTPMNTILSNWMVKTELHLESNEHKFVFNFDRYSSTK